MASEEKSSTAIVDAQAVINGKSVYIRHWKYPTNHPIRKLASTSLFWHRYRLDSEGTALKSVYSLGIEFIIPLNSKHLPIQKHGPLVLTVSCNIIVKYPPKRDAGILSEIPKDNKGDQRDANELERKCHTEQSK